MSYILDALKKSEKEREIGKVPTLHSVDGSGLAHTSKSFPILWIIVVVLSIIVTVLLYFQFKEIAVEVHEESLLDETAHVDLSLPIAVVEVEAGVTQIQSTAETVVPQDVIEVVAQEQVQKRLPQKELAPEQSNEVLLKEGEILITPTSRREAAETPDETSVPLLSETEYDFQDQLPEMHLDVHVYKKHPESRFVLINMDKYREGQKMPSGVVIEAIVIDGVMMNYQGQRFLMPLD
ncbi:MAG: general secretion pathway protein GspB [Gammaproteobacteria bacterium]|nr:general secretion pathway protein GspB [Gammaproteobacteria bacterium]